MKPSVHAETLYLARKTPFRDDYTELPKIKDKPPFYTAAPGGRDMGDYNDRAYLPHAQP